jgi:outer membrane protein assembly factor BamB
MRSIRLALAAALGLSGGVASAENWPEWRGPRHTGISSETGIATQWTKTENVAWKAKLPGQGGSTPVVWDDRIFLTSADGDDLVVMGFDTKGTELWKTKVSTGNKDARAGEGNSASPSPSTDGKHVWVFFGTGDLACLDRDGKIVWKFNVEERYGKIDIQFGMTSTPILHEGKLYLQLIHGTWRGDYTVGKVISLDAASGKEIWAIDRKQNPKEECKHAYSSALIAPGKEPYLITHGGDCTVGHSLKDGHELWRLDDLNGPSQYNKNYDGTLRFVATPTATEEFVVVPTAKSGPALGLQASVLSGNVTGKAEAVKWVFDRTPDVSCPVIYEGLVYLCMNDGRLVCLDQNTGEKKYESRIHNAQYRATGVVSGGHVYFTARDGVCTVVKLGPTFEKVSENDLGEPQTASPVISNGTLYMRTYEGLYAIRGK